MKRPHLHMVVGLVVSTLSVLGCGDGESPVGPTPPVQTTPPPVPPAFQDFRLSGSVSDTASRPLAGSQVEVIDGPRAGTSATTDESGRFSMPGTFTGNITLTASKDGYQRETRPVLPRGAPPPSGNPGGSWSWSMGFLLEPLGPRVNIAGEYVLTFTADSACPDLPAEARTRTYTATIVPGLSSSSFGGSLSGARFLPIVPCPPGPISSPPSCTYNSFRIGMAGDFARISLRPIVEQLSESTYLVVAGEVETSFDRPEITAPLDGFFQYCSGEPVLTLGEYWECEDSVQCDSRVHRLTLVRR